jgi:Fe2+ transport system protein FeoA
MSSNEFPALLSRAELLELAGLAGARAIVGVDMQPRETEQIRSHKKEINRRLSSLGLLDGKKISVTHRKTIQILFHPERALVVVRERPDIGKQILIFLSRQGRFLLHGFPQEGQHRIVNIRPEEIENMLAEWFPAKDGISNDIVLLSEAQLTELISNTSKEIPPELSNINPLIAQRLVTSIQLRKWSGSFLLLKLQESQAVSAESWTAWSGDGQTWLAEQHDQVGVLRLLCGGDYVTGLRRQIVRWLGQFEQIVRAYALSTEELAFVLSLLNRPDLANLWISGISPQETEHQLEKAARSLRVRGLSGISSKGFPLLVADFEQGLTPLLVPSHKVLVRTISSRGTATATLYIQNKRSFCAHFPNGKQHILECGKIEQLPAYLLSLFKGFGERKTSGSKPVSISLQDLTACLDLKNRLDIESNLQKAGLTKSIATQLSSDIIQHEYRASLNRVAPSANDREKEVSVPTLFLLKGSEHDWIFSVPNANADSVGVVLQADRKRLLQFFDVIMNSPSR